jgi:hypothetical protein
MKKIIYISIVALLCNLNIFGQTVTTTAATNITQSSAQLNGTTSGVAFYQFRYGTGASNLDNSTPGTFTPGGNVSTVISGLQSGTTYYFCIYGSVGYPFDFSVEGQDTLSFTTTSLPTITSAAATNIGITYATVGGNITDDGGATVTDRGVYYSTSSGVTTGDTKISEGSTGTGTFEFLLESLSSNTTYYYKAYATNSIGTKLSDNEINFTTLSKTVPTAINGSATNINTASADVSGDITDDGGATVTRMGICYSTVANPDTNDFKKTYSPDTGPFTVTLIGLSSGTKYYYRAWAVNSEGIDYADSDGTFTTHGTTEWTGGSSAAWETSSNWSNGVPSATLSVVIPSAGSVTYTPTISSSAECIDLEINPGGILTINDTYTLSVSGNYKMEANSSSSMAQLVIKGSGSMSVTGTSQTELYLHSTSSSVWQLISPPVANAAINVVSGYFANSYNETTNSWTNLNIGDNLTKGNGYSVKNSSGNPELVFTGLPNNGDQSITITSTNSNGWNLIGNPYPSTIDWESSDWTRSVNYDSTVYTYDYDNQQYTSYNRHTNASTNNGTRYIPPMQGFWIHVSDDDTGHDLEMTNDVRVSNQQAYWKKSESKEESNNLLKLYSNGNGFSDEIIIAFHSNSTEAFDLAYDAYKLFSSNADIPQLYTTLLPNTDLSVNVLPTLSENFYIPIGFKVEKSGTYTISAEGFESFDESTKFYLEDLDLNILTDLEESSYEFTSGSTNSSGRFLLHMQATEVSVSDYNWDNNYQIYSNGQAIYISANKINKNSYVVVYDILGKEIYKNNLSKNNLQKIENNFTSGMYIVKIHSDRKTLSKKVTIK